MTAPEIRAEISRTRPTLPEPGAPEPFAVKAAARVSQRLADDAATEIRRLDGELAELWTRMDALHAEKCKLMSIARANGGGV